MSGIDDAVSILATGKRLTTGASTANTTIPLNSTGNVPRYIRLICEGTGNANIKLGQSGVTATTADVLIIANEPLILNTNGQPYIAYIQNSAAAVFNVTPLEF